MERKTERRKKMWKAKIDEIINVWPKWIWIIIIIIKRVFPITHNIIRDNPPI